MKSRCAGLRFSRASGQGREWSDERKAEIVAQSCEPGVKVCAVARVTDRAAQLFIWRRLAAGRWKLHQSSRMFRCLRRLAPAAD
ncbi:transposase [Sinorhizobium meliloti]|uniref:transposase n=1 Tax=Rhizobium meliloti TaxID=382 RepID=UPI000A30DE57|nr:transposase [Sinorhizobium meliloti]